LRRGMRRCGMRWSRATVDRWAARGVPFAVTFKRIDKIMFYALDGIHGHTSQDHRFPSEQRSVKLALAGVVLWWGTTWEGPVLFVFFVFVTKLVCRGSTMVKDHMGRPGAVCFESALSFDTPIASRACRKATASTLCCVMLPSASVNSGVPSSAAARLCMAGPTRWLLPPWRR
jgi:hypothetical protein